MHETGSRRGGKSAGRGKAPGAPRLIRTSKPAMRSGKKAVAQPRRAEAMAANTDVAQRLMHAIEALNDSGALAGTKSRKISARVDPGLVEEAKRRTGLTSDADIVTTALAILAAGDDFGAWLVSRSAPFPEDFELAV